MSAGIPHGLTVSIQRRLAEIEGRSDCLVEAQPVAGGCIHHCLRVSTDHGGTFFLKWSPDSTEDAFPTEADGLEALAYSESLRVPDVVGYSTPGESPSWLLLEFVRHAEPADHYWEALGRGLADLHKGRA